MNRFYVAVFGVFETVCVRFVDSDPFFFPSYVVLALLVGEY